MGWKVGGTGIHRRTNANILEQHRRDIDDRAKTIQTSPSVVQRPPNIIVPPVVKYAPLVLAKGASAVQVIDEDSVWHKLTFATTVISSGLFTFDGTDTITVNGTTTIRVSGRMLVTPDGTPFAEDFFLGVGIGSGDPTADARTAVGISQLQTFGPTNNLNYVPGFDVTLAAATGDVFSVWAMGSPTSGTQTFSVLGTNYGPGVTSVTFAEA